MERTRIHPVLQAILAAALFGASAPLAKLLLSSVYPLPLAGLLYLGTGISSALLILAQRPRRRRNNTEAPLGRSDLPWLLGAIAAGGVAAPITLMLSLKATSAATASLLLNFEGVATALIAAYFFREAVGRRVWIAAVCVVFAGILLSVNTSGKWGISLGAVGVVAACILWGIDNNLTRNISAKDPLQIVAIKGLFAGPVSLALAAAVGQPFPDPGSALLAMLLGCVSYGASIALFILALRGLGAARTSSYFGAAPFIGALLSLILFRTLPNALFALSIPFMIIGVVLLLTERHVHVHEHSAMEHEHSHRHDEPHHAHSHKEGTTTDEPHSHQHRHEANQHSHPHAPDAHHRHEHGSQRPG
ncbi:MAG: EamA family transporter [Armatimonadota bacterium]|nr:EamA family transporter [Armatimonadota bacterium]